MASKLVTDLRGAAMLGALLSKDHAEDVLRLLVNYKDVSASEAASRLNLHIRTAQEFLEEFTTLGILDRSRSPRRRGLIIVAPRFQTDGVLLTFSMGINPLTNPAPDRISYVSRSAPMAPLRYTSPNPNYRSTGNASLSMRSALLAQSGTHPDRYRPCGALQRKLDRAIRERKNSGARFTARYCEHFGSVAIAAGEGRSRQERRISHRSAGEAPVPPALSICPASHHRGWTSSNCSKRAA